MINLLTKRLKVDYYIDDELIEYWLITDKSINWLMIDWWVNDDWLDS